MKKLEVGDIVVVSTVLLGKREYPVTRIEGNKAITKFRDFNRRVYEGGNIYEYDGSPNQTTNDYWLKKHTT